MSFSKYINNLRLEYAAKMLKNHPDYTVDTIAQECGMSTQSLYRLFSGKFGVTPTDFQVGVQHINNKNITEDKWKNERLKVKKWENNLLEMFWFENPSFYLWTTSTKLV